MPTVPELPDADPLEVLVALVPRASWHQGHAAVVVPIEALLTQQRMAGVRLDAEPGTGDGPLVVLGSSSFHADEVDGIAASAGARLVAVPEGIDPPAGWRGAERVGSLTVGPRRWSVLQRPDPGLLRAKLAAGAAQRGRAGEGEDLDARGRWFGRRHRP